MSQDKLINFRWELGMYEELKMLALKEHTTVKSLITRELEDYIKKHKDGNPQFKLDQFNDPNFVACPAFWRSLSNWDYYFKRQTPEELEKFKNQIIGIDNRLGKWI